MEEKCICCGRSIPEGRQVCPICEADLKQDEQLVKNQMQIIITEENIDGCEGSANIPVLFNRELTSDEIIELTNLLSEVKTKTPDDEQYTDTMVNKALKIFYEKHKIEYAINKIFKIDF